MGKKSLLGGIASGLRGALLDEDTPTPSSAPSTVEPARPFTPFGGQSATFSAPVPTGAAPVPPLPGQAPVSYAPPIGGLSAEPDPEALTAVQNAVYVPINGQPSNYMRFLEMHAALGNPADTNLALRALAAGDKTTPEALANAVARDVSEHLGLLESFRASVDADFASEIETRLGSKDAEVAELQRLNEVAAGEIKRHTEEIQARTQDIARLQVERTEQEAAIGRGKARMDTAEDHVQNDLIRAQQLFVSTKA